MTHSTGSSRTSQAAAGDAAADHLAAARGAGAECLAAALRYHARGLAPISVCPPDHLGVGKTHGKKCKNPGKAPWGAWGGKGHERLTPDQLRRRWRDNPFCNVGCVMGPASGKVAIDVDGPRGEQSLAELSGGDLPRTPEFTSGREEGGRRLIYDCPEGWLPRTKPEGEEIAPGLTLLGWGSQTVMPPSRHKSGKRYAWVAGRSPDEVPFAPAPAWLVARMSEDKRPAGKRARAGDGKDIPERMRNSTLTSLAGSMRRRGMTCEEMLAALLVTNENRCKPPLDEGEVEGIARSVAGYPPGPAPSANGTPGGGPAAAAPAWEDPLPLTAAPAAAEFPVDVLPGAARLIVEESAAAIRCPADFAAVPALALAGAAIGAAWQLEVKYNWRVQGNLFAASIGQPTSGKTPALHAVCVPLYREQKRLHAEFKQALKEYQQELTQKRQPGEEKPERPVEGKVVVSDCTIEKLGCILAENPNGVAKVHDELTALVTALNQYKGGRGADRQFYLSAWAGEPITVDRKSLESSIFVEHPFLAVFGGMVPDLLDLLRGERFVSDGWLDRFLLSYPAEPKAAGEDWLCIDPRTAEAWEKMLADLRGSPKRVSQLTACGKRAWVALTTRLADEMNADDFPDHLRGPWGKFRTYGARLALILHAMRLSARQTQELNVDGRSVELAAELVRYFQSHARKVYCIIDTDARVNDARRVLSWLTNHPSELCESVNSVNTPKSVSQRDIHARVFGGSRSVDQVNSVISLLIQHGYFMPAPSGDREGPGRKPSPRYAVHPSVFCT
jgi:hypothetical protein